MSNQGATLSSHMVGGRRWERHELEQIATPAATRTWKPIPHHSLVGSLMAGLDSAGVEVVREDYATLGRECHKLFGVFDLNVPGFTRPDMRLAMGFRASNDKSMAIRVLTGARVFVCDNMTMSGDDGAVEFRRIHSGRLDLDRDVRPVVSEFLLGADAWVGRLDKMKEVELSDDRAKAIVLDAFTGRKPVLPVRMLPEVARLYFEDDDQRAKFPERTLWALDNAFTEAVKTVPAGSQHKGNLDIGRYFSRLIKGIASDGARALDRPANPSDN